MKTERFKIYGILLAAALLAPLFRTNAFGERLPIRVFTTADGLGSSFVDGVYRDSRGFLWFSTRDGLSRFDGSRFITYQVAEKNSPPGIEGIFESSRGEYWITTTGGTYRFKPNALAPGAPLEDKKDARPNLNAEYVGSRRGGFYEDEEHRLWFYSDKIYRFAETENPVRFDAVDFGLPERYADLGVLQMSKDADGCFWVMTRLGIYRRLPDGRVIYYDAQTPLVETSFSFLTDAAGNVWLTRPNKLLVIKPEPLDALANAPALTVHNLNAEAIERDANADGVRLPENSGEIISYVNFDGAAAILPKFLYKSSDNHVWMTTAQSLVEFDGKRFNVHSTTQGFTQEPGRMTEDLNGNVWIGGQSGVVRLDRHGLTTYASADASGAGRVRSIFQNRRGEIFAFAGQGLVSRFDGKNFRAVPLQIPAGYQFLWTSTGGFLDRDDEWWITVNQKLYRFAAQPNLDALGREKPLAAYDRDDGLPSDKIYCVFQDSRGRLFVSTRVEGGGDGSGLAQFLPEENRFRRFTADDGFPDGKAPSSFAEDAAGNLWFGFYENGVARYTNGRFTDFSDAINFPAGLVTEIYADRKSRLWLASSNGGLVRVDNPVDEHPQFVHLTTENGLASNNVRSITEDDFGRIYAGSVRGIDRLTPETGIIKHYSTNDGLATDFVDTAFRAKDGALWFGTPSGISRLAPESEGANSPPPVLLGGLRVAGVEKKLSELGERTIGNLELASGENNLQVDFFGIDFKPSETLRYQYRLEGADADWSPPTEERSVNYANLSAGEYRFMVRAVNSEGAKSPQPAAISFKILPPVWARWWFVALCASAAFALFYWFYRYRTARLREVNLALTEAHRAEEALLKSREERIAELERVRTRIATDLHDDIGASLTQIAVLSEVARQKSGGAVVEPLVKISSVSNELVDAMSDIVWAINPKKDHLSDLAQRMRRFASDVLSAKNIRLVFDASAANEKTLVNANVRRETFLIFKELISNIVKHSGAKNVRISLEIFGENLTLEVEDDGRGFYASSLDPNQTTDSQFMRLNPETRGGNGIRNIWRRAGEMRGELIFDSQPGKGATAFLILPLEAATRTGGEAPLENR